MASRLCFQCFKIKGDYEVCPYCGYVENTQAQQAFQLAPGTVLRGRYIIGTCVGIGGFGIIYKAFDTVLGVVVAVKEFYPAGLVNRGVGETKVGVFSGEKQAEFERQMQRFLEEARNMAAFSKEKNIINVFGFFEENQTAYIVMEFIDAPLLKKELLNGRFPVDKAVTYMRLLLDALDKVHQHGIIHKDVSPDNIFLTGPDSIKLFDFGAAKFQETESERTLSMIVKAGYTPPEQYSSKNVQGVFTDIYAAGAVFYEMVTGEKPMDSPERQQGSKRKDHLKRPRDFGIEIDDKLERVILKAMALEPKLRFQSAQEFKNAIDSNRKVDLPQEVIQKTRRLKIALSAAAAAVALTAGGAVVLSQTVFSARGKIDMAKIKEEELSVWLSAEDVTAGQKLSETLLESVENECPQLTVEVEVIAETDYADRLSQALEEDALPDVFCTDSLETEASGCCAELSKLLHTMELSSYLYLEQLESEGSVYSLPTALQAGVVYINEEKDKDYPEYVQLSELSEQGKKLGYADEKNVFASFQDKKKPLCWIAGDMSDMEKVESVTVEAVPSTDFTAIPIVTDGKLAGRLENWYGVKKSGEDNREKASMVLLSLLLSDGAQSTAYMDNREGLPLNREILESYQENKLTTYLAFMNEYDLEDAQLYEGKDICSILRTEAGGDEQ